jgi:predicted unusual protein kinase regulating ubiquinone biosynthesis (AarF/ABC1/UbiB family)
MTEDQLKDEYRRIAERRVRLGLVLAEIGRRDNVQVTDQELMQAMQREAMQYGQQAQQVFEFFRSNPNAQAQLRALIASAHPAYAKVGELTRAEWKLFGTTAPVTDQVFRRPVTQFYLTNDILRASHVMRVCQTNADSAGAMKKAG